MKSKTLPKVMSYSYLKLETEWFFGKHLVHKVYMFFVYGQVVDSSLCPNTIHNILIKEVSN